MATLSKNSIYFRAICSVILLSRVVLVTSVKSYEDKEKVEVYVNKVGPYFNVHETYHYYEIPVCSPEKIEHKALSLGEVLDGDRMAKSLYNIQFKQDVVSEKLCEKKYTADDLAQMKEAIEDLYYFEFVIDDLPVRGFIGRLNEEGILPHRHKMYLYTSLQFTLTYNGKNIISANVSTSDLHMLDITEETPNVLVTFTYSVTWKSTTDTIKERGSIVKKSSFFPKTLEIHWLSVINSMVLVVLLVGFVIIILSRVLKNDFARYNDDLDMDEADQEDNGWKIIHTDVFRFPKQKSLFCAVLGVGCQFLTVATGCLMLALLGTFNVHKHGQLNTAAIVLYAFTSCVSGYVAAGMYKKMEGERWVWNINLTSCLFAVPLFVVWSIINSVAWAYGSTQALPWTTILFLMCFWFLIGYPLTVLGGIIGKNSASSFDSPCRTKNIARELPLLNWYRSAPIQLIVGGFLPFSAISVELYYIFSTLWGRDQYTLWGILGIVYVMVLLVTACITVALVYFQLNAEDYRWWWRSIFTAGSASLFVFGYSMFFFYNRSSMSGALQTVQFFGYTILTCYVFFLSLGTVGFFSALKFVRYIYANVKMD
ncbi:transmembrane 9 superfamily member 1-like [Watersipora subatra]|uniref:transmembrane 9 superfamily member 1-like n=1 Tax=Watersipora subatra TaxID=2589382 RepID=UPI00355AF517